MNNSVPRVPSRKLGNYLLKNGYLDHNQLNLAWKRRRDIGGNLGEIIVDLNLMPRELLVRVIQSDAFQRYVGRLVVERLGDFLSSMRREEQQPAQPSAQPVPEQLGEYLVQRGLLTRDQLAQALARQHEIGGRLGEVCLDMGFISREQLARALREKPQPRILLGRRLLEQGLITQAQLDNALEMQKKSGGRLGDILVFLEYIDRGRLYREIATQQEMARFGDASDAMEAAVLPYEMAQRLGAMVLMETRQRALVAVEERLDETGEREIAEFLHKPITQALVSSEERLKFWEKAYHQNETHTSVFSLYEEQTENSAIVTFSSGQRAVFLGLFAVLLLALFVSWRSTLLTVNVILQSIYFLMTAIKLYIVFKGELKNVQMRYTKAELDAIDERELPVYTILIPVFKEKEVVKKLLKNISTLDYPQYKLDVRILLEEGDEETLSVIRTMKLPNNFTPIVVPHSIPQTKPKACNYGLLLARGKYVVIYDAEDRPEPDQLKKAYLAFKQLPDEYVCVQAKLNYFNSDHNALTRLFTQEYSMWFELLLVGIMQIDMPIPLGGTSNHFKIDFLKQVGGWDPFNVTEDADLGIRLYKYRYKTAVLDSRTWEEANSHVGNWIRQRSRWVKGYMQTWLVHMRRPLQFAKTVGTKGFIGYQAMILGTPLLPLINPFYWALLILWLVTQAGWIQSLFPGFLYYIATVSFVLVNFMFTYMNIIGMYRVIRDCALKNEQPFSYGLIKYALLTPVYWILMSAAAYKALFQLIFKPYYWEKTVHGLTGDEQDQTESQSGGEEP